MSLRHSVREGVPLVTITHDALEHGYPSFPQPRPLPRYKTWDLPPLLQIPDMGPTLRYQTWDLPPPVLLTSGSHHWRPFQTCSLVILSPMVLTSSGWLPEQVSWQASRAHPTEIDNKQPENQVLSDWKVTIGPVLLPAINFSLEFPCCISVTLNRNKCVRM